MIFTAILAVFEAPHPSPPAGNTSPIEKEACSHEAEKATTIG